MCECGKCICEPGYTGSKCECSTDQSYCKKDNDVKLCSGHGSCNCGRCECFKSLNIEYIGLYCETEFNGNCSRFHQCVSAVLDENHDPKLEANHCQIDGSPLEIVRTVSLSDDDNICTFLNDSVIIEGTVQKCYNKFKYSTKLAGNHTTIKLDIYPSHCSESYLAFSNVWIILIGLFILWVALMVLIKLRNIRLDRIEYALFENSNKWAKASTNPIYKSPKTHYEVPLELREQKQN